MSEHKQKKKPKTAKIKKQINNEVKIDEIIIPILPEVKMKPITEKIIKKFVNSLFENEKENIKLNNTVSPSQNKKISKIKHKEILNSDTKNKYNKKNILEKNDDKNKNKRNKTSGKVVKSNSLCQNNNININLDNKKNQNYNLTVSPQTSHYKVKKGKNKNIRNNRIPSTESNVLSPNNKETLGDKMMKIELAREKKICAEKLRIIKEHILSLQKKEEELSKKMMKLNDKENALAKKKTFGENNELEQSYPQMTEKNVKQKNSDKNNEEIQKNIKINFESEHKLDNKEKKEKEEKKQKNQKNEKKEEKKNQKVKTMESTSKKINEKKKIDNKRGKTPEKKVKKPRLINKIVNSRSDKKMPYSKKMNGHYSLEIAKTAKGKDKKK
jgi:hypothetical protein